MSYSTLNYKIIQYKDVPCVLNSNFTHIKNNYDIVIVRLGYVTDNLVNVICSMTYMHFISN